MLIELHDFKNGQPFLQNTANIACVWDETRLLSGGPSGEDVVLHARVSYIGEDGAMQDVRETLAQIKELIAKAGE